jgi:hypothetical protein
LRVAALAAALLAAAVTAAPADASKQVRFGIQDDAWLVSGPGALDDRLDELERLGVDLVRYTLRWDQVAASRPARARTDADAAYDWTVPDQLLRGLRSRRIDAVVTIWGTPAWANDGRTPNVAPLSASAVAAFAYAAASRYSWVRRWLVWNEPNQRRWLLPTTAATYVRRLLNPAYAALHEANPRALVGAGVTGPRGNVGGVSPVAWIRGMGAARAKLDAYAHNPYPTRPQTETPWTGGCGHCQTVTMATLERLLREVERAFGAKRIWLTEHGYQSNPPDTFLGVPPATQARFVAEAAVRAYQTPKVDMLIHFLVVDDIVPGGWQSGLRSAAGRPKPAYRAYRIPLAQVSRKGLATTLWGQVRPRAGAQPYRLQRVVSGRWRWVGAAGLTDARGVFSRTVRAGPGARFRVWSPRDRTYGAVLVVR